MFTPDTFSLRKALTFALGSGGGAVCVIVVNTFANAFLTGFFIIGSSAFAPANTPVLLFTSAADGAGTGTASEGFDDESCSRDGSTIITLNCKALGYSGSLLALSLDFCARASACMSLPCQRLLVDPLCRVHAVRAALRWRRYQRCNPARVIDQRRIVTLHFPGTKFL